MIRSSGKRWPTRARDRAGWLVAAIAVVVAIIGIVLASISAAFTLQSSEASGEVVAVKPPTADEKRPQVVIEFPDRNGQFRRFEEAAPDPTPVVGAEVKVLFDRRRPGNARIEDTDALYGPSLVLGVWTLGLGLVAEELIRGGRRPRPASVV